MLNSEMKVAQAALQKLRADRALDGEVAAEGSCHQTNVTKELLISFVGVDVEKLSFNFKLRAMCRCWIMGDGDHSRSRALICLKVERLNA